MKVILVGSSPQKIQYASSHSHDSVEIILNLEGCGAIEIQDESYNFEPDTISIIPPYSIHPKRSDTYFRDIYIRIESEDWLNICQNKMLMDDEEHSFRELMLFALRVYYKKASNYKALLSSIAETMIQWIISKNENMHINNEIELFKNKLIENFVDPEFSIINAYKNTPYCGDYFRRRFKSETGVTPAKYLMDLRIRYAKKLIKENEGASIQEISLDSGFYDPHYFSRVFKEQTGLSPKEFQAK